MSRTKLLLACTLAASVIFLVGTSVAQTDLLKVDYFANANTTGAPDATVRITNPGESGGNLCADIYVFDVNEEMSSCCSCTTTPDGLLTLSVNNDLTNNPLTGPPLLATGVIKIVSAATTGGFCPLPTRITAVSGLRAWATHIQNSNFTITETASQDATLSRAEGNALQAQCKYIQQVGSGKGICANSAALSAICNN